MGGDSSPSKKSPRKVQAPAATRGKDPCDIRLTTRLAHVRTTQSAHLSPQAALTVEVEQVLSRKTIVCRRRGNREAVGYVLARGAADLINCIEEGNEYTAIVTKVDFGLFEVAIRRSA